MLAQFVHNLHISPSMQQITLKYSCHLQTSTLLYVQHWQFFFHSSMSRLTLPEIRPLPHSFALLPYHKPDSLSSACNPLCNFSLSHCSSLATEILLISITITCDEHLWDFLTSLKRAQHKLLRSTTLAYEAHKVCKKILSTAPTKRHYHETGLRPLPFFFLVYLI